MAPPRSPAQRRRLAILFLIFQLAFTLVSAAVLLSRPIDPRRVTVLVGLVGVTLVYACNVWATSRRTPPPEDKG